jgi:hypothetical protein
MMKKGRTLSVAAALAGVIALGLLVSVNPSHAELRGRCTTTVVEEPFRLPTGRVVGPGKLTLCTTVKYSPVSWLHKTYVNRYAVEMMLSVRGTSEGLPSGGQPLVMLHRDADGLLHLDGYAISAGKKMVTYRLDLARVKAEQRLAKRRGTVGSPAGPSTLFLAARVE